jgi:hypothetical protein
MAVADDQKLSIIYMLSRIGRRNCAESAFVSCWEFCLDHDQRSQIRLALVR